MPNVDVGAAPYTVQAKTEMNIYVYIHTPLKGGKCLEGKRMRRKSGEKVRMILKRENHEGRRRKKIYYTRCPLRAGDGKTGG